MGYDGTLKFDTKVDESGFEKGVSKIGSLASGAIKTTTAVIGGASTAIVGLGTAAVKVGSEFEASMSNVAAISGATGNDLDKLTAKAQEMGAKTKFSASESADAFSYMAMAGWKTEDMLGGIEGIMNLAAASGEDLATTSDIVTDALTAFGLSAQDSGHFADILAAASSNANTNVGLMGETFKYVAPVAGSLGFSAEDCAQAIGLMANAGIKGSQAGTALRSTFTRLAKPTKESSAAMEALGLSLTDEQGNVKELNVLLDDMRTSFSTLTDAEKAEYAAMIAGQEGMSGLLAIVNASEADYNKLSTAIANSTDETTGFSAAQQMAEKQVDNLQGQMTILKSGLEGFGIKIYQSVDNPLKDVVKTAQGMVQQLTEAFDKGGFDGLVSAVGDVLSQVITKIAEAAPKIIDMAVSLVHSFCEGLKNADGLAESAAELVTSLADGILSCAGDLWTTAITLITQLVLALEDHLPEILQTGIDVVLSIIDGITEAIPQLLPAAARIVGDLAKNIVDNLPDIVDAAIELIMAFIDGLMDAMPELIDAAVEVFSALIDAIPVVIDKILKVLPELITKVVNLLVKNIPKIIQGGVKLFSGLVKAIPKVITSLVKALPKIIEAIVDALPDLIESLIDGLMDCLPDLIDGVISLVTGLVQALPTIITLLVKEIPNLVTKIVTALVNCIPQLVEGAIKLFMGILEAIPQIVIEIVKAMPQIIAAIVQGLLGGIGEVFAAAGELFFGIVDNSKEAQEEIQKTNEEIKAYADSLSEVSPQIADYNSLLSDTGNTLSDLNQQQSDAENGITEVLKQALKDQQGLRDEDLTKIREYMDELNAIIEEKMEIYRSQQISELKKLQLESGAITQETAAQHLANVEEALTQANQATEDAYTSRLTIIEQTHKAAGTIGSQAYQDELTAAKAAYDEQIAENQSYYTSALEIIGEKSAEWVQIDSDKWAALTKSMGAFNNDTKDGFHNFIMNAADWQGTFNGVKDSYVEALNEMDRKSANGFLRMATQVTASGGKIDDKSKEIAANILGAFDNLPENMDKAGKDALVGMIYGLEDEIPELKDTSEMSANEIVDTIKEYLGINSPSKELRKLGNYAGEGLSDGLKEKKGDISSAGESLASSIYNAVSNGIESMVTVGRNLVSGLWNGITQLSGWLWNNVSSWISGIWDGICNFFGIHSPSTRMRDFFFFFFVKGLAEGIALEGKTALDAVNNLAEDIANVDFVCGDLDTSSLSEQIDPSVSAALKSETLAQMKFLANKMQATVKAEALEISYDKTGQQQYEQAAAERRSRRFFSVTGTLEGDRPIEVHTNLYLDKRKFAEEITPAINHEMYKIDAAENNRGRGN